MYTFPFLTSLPSSLVCLPLYLFTVSIIISTLLLLFHIIPCSSSLLSHSPSFFCSLSLSPSSLFLTPLTLFPPACQLATETGAFVAHYRINKQDSTLQQYNYNQCMHNTHHCCCHHLQLAIMSTVEWKEVQQRDGSRISHYLKYHSLCGTLTGQVAPTSLASTHTLQCLGPPGTGDLITAYHHAPSSGTTARSLLEWSSDGWETLQVLWNTYNDRHTTILAHIQCLNE